MEKFASYRLAIDKEIENFVKTEREKVLSLYGENQVLVLDAFLEILGRGGKRVRGSLVMHAYFASGGKDEMMIAKAALAVEMLHAYILIIDDIQDRSLVRRDGPSGHILLKNKHEEMNYSGDSEHFGIATALNAALLGCHTALNVISNLNIDKELVRKAIVNINNTFIVTAHGQTGDIFNEVVDSVTEKDLDNVLVWKTANYTVMGPLQLGMILAGKTPEETELVKEYSLYAGRVFQITDDIIGIFSDSQTSGKNPHDDVREGKRTILTIYALEHLKDQDKMFVMACLGNENITDSEFNKFQELIEMCGALDYAQDTAKNDAQKASEAVGKLSQLWSESDREVLEVLVNKMIGRTS